MPMACPVAAASPERVAIPAAGWSSSAAPLAGFVFRPAGSGPFPSVVMMHGCGGAYGRDGSLNARHQMWGEYFAGHGYIALMLDSFSSRGIKEICTVKFSNRALKESDRVGDAYAALAWLRAQAGVDAGRSVLLGWSHGAGVTLDAITRAPAAMPGFRAAVAFYPGCTTRARNSGSFHPYAPLLVLIGEADDWTPAAPCVSLAAAAAARGEPMQIVTYPGTYHDFDNPALSKTRVRSEVPNGVNPGQGVTTGPNPEAREDAKLRVLKFFADYDKRP
jgi:dienelactone hydrolase